jgi:hypothetical protein
MYGMGLFSNQSRQPKIKTGQMFDLGKMSAAGDSFLKAHPEEAPGVTSGWNATELESCIRSS